jgi:hypothetical protein
MWVYLVTDLIGRTRNVFASRAAAEEYRDTLNETCFVEAWEIEEE